MEALKDRKVIFALLGEFDFPSGILRTWTGEVSLTTEDGRVWQPIGDFGTLQLPTTTANIQSASLTVGIRRRADENRLSYRDFAAAVLADVNENIEGRDMTIYMMAFRAQDDAGGMAGTPYSAPRARYFGQMSHAITERTSAQSLAFDIVSENQFVDGHLPSSGFYTAEDQRARFAGDEGLDMITQTAVVKRINWPRD